MRFGALGAMAIVGIVAAAAQLAGSGRPDGSGAASTLADIARPDGLAAGLRASGTLLCAIGLAVCATSMAQEYSLGTLRNLLVRRPERWRVFGAKLAALAGFLVTGVTVAAGTSIVTSMVVAAARDVDTGRWWSLGGLAAVAGAWLEVGLAVVGFGLIGIVVAIALRSPALAVGAGLAWLLPAETILTGIWHPLARFLPGQLLQALADGGTADVGVLTALAGAFAVAVAASAAGLLLLQRRDVTS
jgi:hypothetical protein